METPPLVLADGTPYIENMPLYSRYGLVTWTSHKAELIDNAWWINNVRTDLLFGSEAGMLREKLKDLIFKLDVQLEHAKRTEEQIEEIKRMIAEVEQRIAAQQSEAAMPENSEPGIMKLLAAEDGT